MTSRGWFERFRRLSYGSRGRRRSLLKVFESGTPPDERMDRLEDILTHPRAAADFKALSELSRGEAPLMRELETLARSGVDGERLRRIAETEIRALAPGRRKRRPAPALWIPAAAAAGILAAVLALSIFRSPEPVADTERASRMNAFEALSPRGDAVLAGLEFRWSPVRGAKRYILEILDPRLAPVYKRDMIEGESFSLPPEAVGRLESGGVYFWKVTAVLEGERRIESGFEKFRISGT